VSPFKKLFFQLRLYQLLEKPATKLLSIVHFIRFCKWMATHRQLEVNDYPTATEYRKRYRVHEYIADQLLPHSAINYLEFGTADCETFFWWLQRNKNEASRFNGFDTFTGLPEQWGSYPKGAFSLEGNIPDVKDPRAALHKGLFQDTLHDFLKTFDNAKTNVILLDADLYSATLFVLSTIAPFLKDGDIFIFDEFSSPQHEYLAYEDFLKSFTYLRLECFAAANNYACVAFRVQRKEGKASEV